MTTGKIAALVVGFLLLVIIIAGCNIAVAAFQPNQPMPMYQQGEMDD